MRRSWPSLAIFLIIAGLGYLWKIYRRNNALTNKWNYVGVIEKIVMYPLKSGSPKELDEAECAETGLREIGDHEKVFLFRDRCFVVYEASNRKAVILHNRRKAILISVESIDEDTVQFRAPDCENFNLDMSSVRMLRKHVQIILFPPDVRVQTVDCGDEVAEWLSRYLKLTDESYRLGYFMENVVKRPNLLEMAPFYSKYWLSFYKHWRSIDSGLYAYASSYLIVNSTSVDDVNNKLPPEDRFSPINLRPNIVVRGNDKYLEDYWKWIRIGDEVVMRTVKPCNRCATININPYTAERNKHYQPVKILRTYRNRDHLQVPEPEKNLPYMGLFAGLYRDGKVKIGDPVYASS